MMIPRLLQQRLIDSLNTVPVVALLGARQVGKTTLALAIAKQFDKQTAYLDLELDTDRNKLHDPEAYLRRFTNKLLIIDEVQRQPDLFRLLRGLVDLRKRDGERAGQFLLLGSASRDLLQHSSETLAGRIRFLELCPFSALEARHADQQTFALEQLWFRGGFPDSYLAASDDQSWDWRSDFIESYLEKDIPVMGAQVAAATIRRLWTMLAHSHGQRVNLSKFGESLGVSHTTVRHYLDILTNFYMLRQIQPWSGNSKKRLVKSPKIYLRDTGIMHRLLHLPDMESLLGHPCIGASWEGFVIENIIINLSNKWLYSYYRTSSQAEIDLVLEGPAQAVWAIEVKRALAPTPSKGFYLASNDIKATKKFIIYPGSDRFPMPGDIEVLGLVDFLQLIRHH